MIVTWMKRILKSQKIHLQNRPENGTKESDATEASKQCGTTQITKKPGRKT